MRGKYLDETLGADIWNILRILDSRSTDAGESIVSYMHACWPACVGVKGVEL